MEIQNFNFDQWRLKIPVISNLIFEISKKNKNVKGKIPLV